MAVPWFASPTYSLSFAAAKLGIQHFHRLLTLACGLGHHTRLSDVSKRAVLVMKTQHPEWGVDRTLKNSWTHNL